MVKPRPVDAIPDWKYSNKPAFRLLRFHPGIRACQLNCHVRQEDVQGVAIGGTAVLDMPIIFLSIHCGKLESCLSEVMDTNYR
jgi:hypothetical protein